MISNISLYQSLGRYNQYFKVNNLNKTNNLSSITNTYSSLYKNGTYSLYDNNNANFIANYISSLSNLKGFTSNLSKENNNSIWNNLSIKSSNSNILTANSFFNQKEKASYSINVKQIASKQINKSNTLTSSDKSTFGAFKLNITSKNKNYSFDIDSTNKTNNEMFLDIAAKINKNNIGIFATVTEKDNKTLLEISSDKTGENEEFTISGSDEFNKKTNLNNASQVAQNAIYEIIKNGESSSKVEKTSSSNDVDIDGYKISATLKNVGQANINVGLDSNKIYEATKNFVSAYNSSISLLQNNIDRGTGVSKQLNNLQLSDAYKKELSSIGIKSNTYEKLIIDYEEFYQQLTDNPAKVQNILGSKYNVVANIGNKAERAIKEPSINLINNSIYSNKTENSYDLSSNNSFYNQMKLLGLYNKNGQFGMINYSALGLLLNIFA